MIMHPLQITISLEYSMYSVAGLRN